MAAAYGFPEIVDELIAAGAKINSVIEAAGAGDLTGWSIAELSDFERACALRAAAVNERLTIIDQCSPPAHRSMQRWTVSPPSTGHVNKADRALSNTWLAAVLHGRADS